jgi:LuxR family maltose regulon positive regulatory protein
MLTMEARVNEHMPRPRVTALLAEAAKQPLAIVLAGAGFGKTRAVRDFTRGMAARVLWMQFSEKDNACSRFWAKYMRIISGWNADFAESLGEEGFPDTEDKINRHLAERRRYAPDERRLIVLDDLHLIEDPDILLFLGRGLREAVRNTSVIIICRRLPEIGLAAIQIRGLVPVVTEEDLGFSAGELAEYLSGQGLEVPKRSQRSIHADTAGWPFSVNLVARSLRKSPGYEGYVQVAMKRSVSKLMEAEAFDTLSEKLRRFLVRISLIDHLSGELVGGLAGGDAALLEELGRQSAYVRFEADVNAWLIHHLFLEFLRSKQELITEGEKAGTFRAAAQWCAQNGFEIDALGYYERLGDYAAGLAVLRELPVQMSPDIALFSAGVFERAPESLAYELEHFAVMRVRVLNRLGRWEEALALMRAYEGRLLQAPGGEGFRDRTLGLLYYTWGNLRALLCTQDGHYDFDTCYAKMEGRFAKAPVEPDQYANLPIGFWASLSGSPEKGAPQRYIEAAKRAVRHVTRGLRGATAGLDTLCEAELRFYQGDIKSAEPIVEEAMRQARQHRQFEPEDKALFYLLRIALWQGDTAKAEQVLREMGAKLDEKGHHHRYLNYDAALAWHYCGLRQPEMVPAWLKERFSAYSHAYYVENQGNQLKARYHYQARNFPPLLAYIEGALRREAVIYGRVEMLALGACVHYQMKEREKAMAMLEEAYGTASPNGIVAPFIELGRDTRTLASAALREAGGEYAAWLENIRRRSASFAKTQALIVSAYEKAHGAGAMAQLSAREREILQDLYIGLSRTEIAAKQALSVNTVNSALNSIFNKLGAKGAVDAVRIAAEGKLV